MPQCSTNCTHHKVIRLIGNELGRFLLGAVPEESEANSGSDDDDANGDQDGHEELVVVVHSHADLE